MAAGEDEALTVGGALTVRLRVALPVHPLSSEPLMVYVCVEDGLAVTLLPVVPDKPVPGDHV